MGAEVMDAVKAQRVIALDGDAWLLATDPQNVGREEEWYRAPRPEARPAKVPWSIQDVFPGYQGVAWYWRDFVAPVNPHPDGRCLLRFWAVDYMAEVWLNGAKVGEHEDGETPFTLDVTGAVRPGADNRLAIRVLNPQSGKRIDGIIQAEIARRGATDTWTPGAAYNTGGIADSVELLIAPAVRVEDLFVRPNPKTGEIAVQVNVRNAGARPARGRIEITVAPASNGETLCGTVVQRDLPIGDTLVEATLRLDNPRLWDVNDPFLYRLTARVSAEGDPSADESSVRCGFRDFRFENGHFRLNGRRIYIRCAHYCCDWPVGGHFGPYNADVQYRDFLDAKVMGFNAVRFLAGVAMRSQLDLCDEIGLMVYEESFASWKLQDSPQMGRRYGASVLGMVRRDRNHPCVTMWGMLNETHDGPVFRRAVACLPALRALDDTRLVLLNSGQWDRLARPNESPKGPPVGCLSNPGSVEWQDLMSDQHAYPRVPHTAATIAMLRTRGQGGLPLFLSEYGIGSGMDFIRLMRHYEQLGKADCDDAVFFRAQLARFLEDWQRWRMDEAFGRPEEFFAQSLRKMAGQRLLGFNAIRANPACIGHSMTMLNELTTGEGLTTQFRERKPGTIDAVFDGWAPLRWCLFAEPANAYRNAKVRLEAVLANEDVLAPGEYPARMEVRGPDARLVFERRVKVTIPDRRGRQEPPFALPVFAEDATIDGPPGGYRFLATFERAGAAAGGEATFHLTDPAEMPAVAAEIVLWGEAPALADWLKAHGVRTRGFGEKVPAHCEVILACGKAPAPGGARAFGELARRIARGATAIFLDPAMFAEQKDATRWIPLRQKGTLTQCASFTKPISRGLYLSDDWAKKHPIFDGLPAGGLLDYAIYRDVIPDLILTGQEPPAQAVAGATNVSWVYGAGLTLAVYKLGAGSFVLNTMRIHENLGSDPVAERLLRNMLNYAAGEAGRSPADLPEDFETQLRSIYQ